MQTSPRTACEIENFNRALSEMKLAAEKSNWYQQANLDPKNLPAWVESAFRQHALFFAVSKCNTPMALGYSGWGYGYRR